MEQKQGENYEKDHWRLLFFCQVHPIGLRTTSQQQRVRVLSSSLLSSPSLEPETDPRQKSRNIILGISWNKFFIEIGILNCLMFLNKNCFKTLVFLTLGLADAKGCCVF